MINFIIVTESLFISSYIEDKIDSTLFKSNFEYKTYLFNNYNDNFFKVAFSNIENKVFIFDLDNQENGFNIAKKIRNNDKLSEIIFIGNYNKDYINNFLISSIKAFAYIDKKSLSILESKLEEIVNSYNLSKLLVIKTISSYNIIKISDILFIEVCNRKTIIHTISSMVTTSKSLSYLENKLKLECDFFIQTHRACLVNLNNVISIDFKKKEIIFFNNKKCNLISRNYKGIIKDKVDTLSNR